MDAFAICRFSALPGLRGDVVCRRIDAVAVTVGFSDGTGGRASLGADAIGNRAGHLFGRRRDRGKHSRLRPDHFLERRARGARPRAGDPRRDLPRQAADDLALADGTGAIRLDPAPVEAYDSRGTTLVADKKYLPALDDFDRAIKLAPDYAKAFSGRAATFGEMRETRLAVRDYTEALRLQPDLAMALNNRGVAWRDKGDKRKALADFKATVALDSSLVVAKEHARQMQQQIAAAAHPGKPLAPLHALSDPAADEPSQ
jgi:tetratricopeptide (TPR) repeat protein